jgi:hypothetical protein
VIGFDEVPEIGLFAYALLPAHKLGVRTRPSLCGASGKFL